MPRAPLSAPWSLEDPQGLDPLVVSTHHGLRFAQVADPPERRAGVPAAPAALVLGFHGGGGGAPRFAIRSGLAEALQAQGLGGVFPQANSHWADGRGQLEEGWAADLDLVQQLRADRGRGVPLALIGVSNGGMFAQRLACELEPAAAAIVSVAANMPADYLTEAPAGAPVPVMLVQAPGDPIIPWGGGWMPRLDEDMPGGKLLSADETLSFWMRRNQVPSARVPLVTTGYMGDVAVEIRAWEGAAPVWRVVVQGVGHGWLWRKPGQALAGSLEDLVARFVLSQIRARAAGP